MITTKSKLIAMIRRAIELIKDVSNASEDSGYKDGMDSRATYLKSKLECEVPVEEATEDIWANELYSIFLESVRYIASPESWADNIPLLLWSRGQERAIQIVDDGEDEIIVTYHKNNGDIFTYINTDVFLGETNSSGHSI